jgi:putative ABC transport system permease protein
VDETTTERRFMLGQTIRYAWRSLANNSAFTGIAVACMALGDGATFTILDGVLLKPFPFRDPDRIVVIDSTNARIGDDQGGLSYPDYRDIRDHSSTLES